MLDTPRLVAPLLVLALGACGGAATDRASTATPVEPEAPVALAKLGGDAQLAAPGARLAVAPSVRVTDALGRPAPGIPVTFAADAEGAVEVARATTDSAGEASCGAWKLGDAVGIQTLTASVSAETRVTFTATAARASPDLTVHVLAPMRDQLVGTTFPVTARVLSTYQLASVTASVGASPTVLTYSAAGRLPDSWSGTVPAAGLSSGPRALVVTAIDVFGHAADLVVPVRLDPPPVVEVTAPPEDSLARPTLAVAATCADDAAAGCASLRVYANGTEVASGTVAFGGVVDLSAWEGQAVDLQVVGVDAAGQVGTATRHVLVESSPKLEVVATVPGGTAWDVSGSRVLYLGGERDAWVLRLLDLQRGTTQDVATAPDVDPWSDYGFVTPTGVIYAHEDTAAGYPFCWLHEWRDGALARLAGLNSCTSLRVAGGYALYSEATADAGATILRRRDLASGASVAVSTSAINWGNDVAASGDVVYAARTGAGYAVYRWRDGTSAPVSSTAAAVPWDVFPVTDGQLVVWSRQEQPAIPAVMLHDGAEQVVLAEAGRGYAVANGWVAYAVPDATAHDQIRRHRGGVSEQVTFFGAPSRVEALDADGTIVLASRGRRYRSVPGAALEDVGSSLGSVVARDGRFYVLLRGTVLRLLP